MPFLLPNQQRQSIKGTWDTSINQYTVYTYHQSGSTISAGSSQTSLYIHLFNGPFSGTTQVSQYQKGKTNLDFTETRDSEWQWHQLGHMQVCTSLQTDDHTSTPPLSFLQAGCPSCRPTNSVKALKAQPAYTYVDLIQSPFHFSLWSRLQIKVVAYFLLQLYTSKTYKH